MIKTIFLFAFCSVFIPQTASSGIITKKIEITNTKFEYSKNAKGTPGIKSTISGTTFGVPINGFKIRTTMRFPNGKPVLAARGTPRSSIGKGGRVIASGTLNLKPGASTFSFWTFIPMKSISLPRRTNTVIIRMNLYNGKIGSYYDGEVKLLKNRLILTRGVLLGPVRCESESRTFNRPNNAGMDVATPNFKVMSHSLVFRSKNNVLACKNKPFYSGVLLKTLSGKEILPSKSCPKKNISKLGYVQVERKININGPNVHWNGKLLSLPLNWLKLDRSRVNHVVATYFTTSGGLWNVREFEVKLPSSYSRTPTYRPKKVASNTTSSRTTASSTRVSKPTGKKTPRPPSIPATTSTNALALIEKVTINSLHDLSKTRILNPYRNFCPDFQRQGSLYLNFKKVKNLSGIRNDRVNRFMLRVNGVHTFHMYWAERSFFYANIPLIMLQGNKVKMEIISLDAPIAPYVWKGSVKLKREHLVDVKKDLNQKLRYLPELKRAAKIKRSDSSHTYLASGFMDLGKYSALLGRFGDAQKYFKAGIASEERVKKKTDWHLARIADMYSMLALTYAMNGEFAKFTQTESENAAACKAIMNYFTTHQEAKNAHWYFERQWDIAEAVLTFTGDEKTALKLFRDGWRMWKPHLNPKKPKGYNPRAGSSSFYALKAILIKHGIDFRYPDRSLKSLNNIPEYRDFRGMDDRRASMKVWDRWLDIQCAALVKTVKSYPDVHNRIVVLGETEENISEGLLIGYRKTNMGPLARLLARDELPPECRDSNVYARVTRHSEGRLRAAILSAKPDSLLPKDIMRMSLKSCLGSYPMAVLTAHAILKTAGKKGRSIVEDMRDRAGQNKWKKLEKLRPDLKPYSEIAKRLINLRPQTDGTGDKLGPWYHIFGILTAGAMVSPLEADIGAIGEHFSKWMGWFGKAEGDYNKVKCTIDFRFSDDAAAKLSQYGRFPPSNDGGGGGGGF